MSGGKTHPLYTLYHALRELDDPEQQYWVVLLCVRYHRNDMPWSTLVLDLAALNEDQFAEAEGHYLTDPSRVQRLPGWLASRLGRNNRLSAEPDWFDPVDIERWRDAFEASILHVRRIRTSGYDRALRAARTVLLALRGIRGHTDAWAALEGAVADGAWESRLLPVLFRHVQSEAMDCRADRAAVAAERAALAARYDATRRDLDACHRTTVAADTEMERLRARLYDVTDAGVECERLLRSLRPRSYD
jgi:hypothetical protein